MNYILPETGINFNSETTPLIPGFDVLSSASSDPFGAQDVASTGMHKHF